MLFSQLSYDYLAFPEFLVGSLGAEMCINGLLECGDDFSSSFNASYLFFSRVFGV